MFWSSPKVKVLLVAVFAAAIGVTVFVYHHRARAVPSFARSDSTDEDTQSNAAYAAPREVIKLKSRAVKESSGLVASRINAGVFWTHNDSGDGPFLYAFDLNGSERGVWRVTDASARDWEGLASGPGPDSTKNYLYIGDIGDNGLRRTEIVVYRLPEPTVKAADAQTDKRNPAATQPAEGIRLRYPDGSHNCEALLVHPKSGNIYVVTKEVFGSPRVFQALAPFNSADVATMKELAALSIPGLFGGVITDGSISPDGGRVVLCDYTRGYELVLSSDTTDFDSIWKQTLVPVSLGSRKQGEAVTYRRDGRAIFATSEGTPMPLIEIARK
jgi:hypothetical protein